MADRDIVMIGLPSEGLRRLAEHFDIRHLEDAEISRACANVDGPCDFTPASLAGRLRECFEGGAHRRILIIYQTPWRFLERQTIAAAPREGAAAQLESFARNTLELWHAFHASLPRLHREYQDRCLLINGDRLADIQPVAALVEERFGFRLRSESNLPAREGNAAAESDEDAWCLIVDALAPQCTDLYAELESCAELMGRQPELDLSGFAGSRAHVAGTLRLLARQSAIDSLLDQYGIAPRAAVQLEAILREWQEYGKLGQRLAVLSDAPGTGAENLERLIESLKEENELCLLQLHQMQGELEHHFKVGQQKKRELVEQRHQKDQQLAELQKRLEQQTQLNRQKEQKRLEQQTQLNRQKEQQLIELQKRLEQQTQLNRQKEQKRLEQQIQLNRQKEQQLIELRERLVHQAKLLIELRRQLELQSAPALRKIARRILRRGNSDAGADTLEQAKSIRASGLFDEGWYRETYPDIAQAGLDPIEHYLKHGVSEGRNPSAHFDTRWYLKTYPDVAATGLNPLLHYIRYGKAEGRQPMRLVA